MATAFLILGATALLARAQTPAALVPPPPIFASLVGQVVDEEDGHPIANARVGISAGEIGAPVVLTDRDGRFSLPVPRGRHHLMAGKSGYASTTASAAAGDRIKVPLRRGAIISGRVVDEYGEPVLAARVVAETPSDIPTDRAFSTSVETDDRGDFRLPGLPAEAFLVSVSRTRTAAAVQTEDDQAARTYYPGVPGSMDAERLSLAWGEERPGVDFTLPADLSIFQPFSVGSFGQPVRPPASNGDTRKSGTIRGHVLSTDGRWLPFALVRLISRKDERQNFLTRAGNDGQFEFSEVPAGAFRLLASKVGYVPGASGEGLPRSYAANDAGRSIDLAEGQVRNGFDLTLARWSTLAGQVLDEYGYPVQGASVQLLQIRYQHGRRRLVQTDGSNRRTDERGRYRIYAIAPGQYIVSAVVGAVFTADLPGYVRSYSPGTPNASEAQIVSIGAAQDVTGIDVMLSRAPTGRIAGQVLNAAGEPSGSGSLTLMPSQRSTAVANVSVGARYLPDGRFEFPNVPPGEYVIQANRGRPNRSTEGEFGALRVTVSGADVRDLVLQTSSGSLITGHFSFATSDPSKQPSASALELRPQPADFDFSPSSNVASADVEPDWTFRMAGVNGPRRLELTRVPAGWALDRILANGIDVTDEPLLFGQDDQSLGDVEVVLTDRISQVKGLVSDDHGVPAAGAIVVLFPTDQTRWYPSSRFLRKAAVRTDGTFTVTGLPSGNYHAAAVAQVPSLGADEWQDPDFLDSLIFKAATLTLAEGESLTANLRLSAR